GALVRVSARRIKVAMASACPVAHTWGCAAKRLAAAANAREIDAGCPRRCSLEHEFKAPERCAQRVTNARLTFVVNGIGFHDPIGQAIPTAVHLEPLHQLTRLCAAPQEPL